MLADAAGRGAEVRLCFGDPASDAVATRDREEELGGTLAAQDPLGADLLPAAGRRRGLRAAAALDARCTRRCSGTTMRSWSTRTPTGEPASANPTLHLRRLDGGQLADHYIACFERVWETAKPWNGEEV